MKGNERQTNTKGKKTEGKNNQPNDQLRNNNNNNNNNKRIRPYKITTGVYMMHCPSLTNTIATVNHTLLIRECIRVT